MTNISKSSTTKLRELLDELAVDIGYTPRSFDELEALLPALLDRLEKLERVVAQARVVERNCVPCPEAEDLLDLLNELESK